MEPQAYAVYRGALEAGIALNAKWKATGEVHVEAKHALDSLQQVIPEAVFAAVLAASSGQLEDPDAPEPTAEEQALIATKAFGDPQLRVALDAAAGQTYSKIVAQAPEAETGDITWWTVALAAAGVLSWIGKLKFKGAIVATAIARLLYWLIGAGVVTTIAPELYDGVKQALKDATGAVGDAGKSTGRLLWWVLAGVGVVTVAGVGVWVYNVLEDDKAKRRARREVAAEATR